MKPALDWISDQTQLGAGLSADLKRIYRNSLGKQILCCTDAGRQ